MTGLIVAAAFFLALHLLVAGTKIRDALVARLGQGAYLGLFSLASVGGLVWLIFAFGQARHDPTNYVYWSLPPAVRHPVIALVAIAFLFIVSGLLTNSPTRVAGDSLVDSESAATGMIRITRHPFLWGSALWAVAHLIANGRTADIILFGSILFLTLAGTASIDAKRQRALGERYTAFKAKTSNIPFAAIVQGRQSLRFGEIWWRLAVSLLVWVGVLFGHQAAFGVNPLG